MNLQFSKREFFELTPRLFAQMCDAWREEQKAARRVQRTLFALLRADVINSAFNRPKRRILPTDLLPKEDLELVKIAGPRRRLTEKRRREIADGFRKMFAGQVEGA